MLTPEQKATARDDRRALAARIRERIHTAFALSRRYNERIALLEAAYFDAAEGESGERIMTALRRNGARMQAMAERSGKATNALQRAAEKSTRLLDEGQLVADIDAGEIDARVDWALTQTLDRLEKAQATLERNLEDVDEMFDELAKLLPPRQ